MLRSWTMLKCLVKRHLTRTGPARYALNILPQANTTPSPGSRAGTYTQPFRTISMTLFYAADRSATIRATRLLALLLVSLASCATVMAVPLPATQQQ